MADQRSDGENDKKKILLNLSPGLYEIIKKAAQDQEKTITGYIRDLIREQLARDKYI